MEFTSLKSENADEVVELLQGWDQEYVPLKAGKYAWSLNLIEVGDFQIFEEYFGGPTLARGIVPEGCVAFAVPQIVSEDCLFLGQTISIKSGLMGSFPQAFELKSGQQLKHIVFVSPIKNVMDCARAMKRPLAASDCKKVGIVLTSEESYHNFSCYLQELVLMVKSISNSQSKSADFDALKQLIASDILPLFVDLLTAEPVSFLGGKDSERRRLVKQAEAMMERSLKQPITLTDLCQGIGQSQRSLYYAFNEAYGLPPMQYLKVLRLHGLRKALKKSDPAKVSVLQIATDWGFWHSGQLAKDYKRLFGQTPKHTLCSG